MCRDGLNPLPAMSPGTSALLCAIVVWFAASSPPTRAQQSPSPAPVPAPLPKNLTPEEVSAAVAVPEPASTAQPLLDPSCEPTFQSGLIDDCEYCLELWQGYCQEKRRCDHVVSPRRGLSCFGLCWPRLCWWGRGCGIPIGWPRISNPACASGCTKCSEAHRTGAPLAREKSAAHVEITSAGSRCMSRRGPAAACLSPARPRTSRSLRATGSPNHRRVDRQ